MYLYTNMTMYGDHNGSRSYARDTCSHLGNIMMILILIHNYYKHRQTHYIIVLLGTFPI